MNTDELAKFKKIQINNYFSTQYDLSENYLDVNQIKNDLQQLIGEVPGVELNYETETLLTEDGSSPIKHEKLSSITIYYTYDINVGQGQTIPRFEKMSYFI